MRRHHAGRDPAAISRFCQPNLPLHGAASGGFLSFTHTIPMMQNQVSMIQLSHMPLAFFNYRLCPCPIDHRIRPRISSYSAPTSDNITVFECSLITISAVSTWLSPSKALKSGTFRVVYNVRQDQPTVSISTLSCTPFLRYFKIRPFGMRPIVSPRPRKNLNESG